LPQPGTQLSDGKRTELDSDAIEKQVSDTRKAWKKANPDASEGTGPYPYFTRVLIARQGVAVPQTLRVTFADDSLETVQFDGAQRWQRFSWSKPVRAVSAQLDPEQHHYLDVSKADDGRTLEPDKTLSRRWSSDAAAVLQNLYALLVTL